MLDETDKKSDSEPCVQVSWETPSSYTPDRITTRGSIPRSYLLCVGLRSSHAIDHNQWCGSYCYCHHYCLLWPLLATTTAYQYHWLPEPLSTIHYHWLPLSLPLPLPLPLSLQVLVPVAMQVNSLSTKIGNNSRKEENRGSSRSKPGECINYLALI
jgi:hypothetical protein